MPGGALRTCGSRSRGVARARGERAGRDRRCRTARARRLTPPLLERADLTLLLTRGNLPATLQLGRGPSQSGTERPVGCAPELLMIGEGQPYRATEVTKVLGLPVVAGLPDDPDAAAVYHRGASPTAPFRDRPVPARLSGSPSVQAQVARGRFAWSRQRHDRDEERIPRCCQWRRVRRSVVACRSSPRPRTQSQPTVLPRRRGLSMLRLILAGRGHGRRLALVAALRAQASEQLSQAVAADRGRLDRPLRRSWAARSCWTSSSRRCRGRQRRRPATWPRASAGHRAGRVRLAVPARSPATAGR
jgi:hypothetical protein